MKGSFRLCVRLCKYQDLSEETHLFISIYTTVKYITVHKIIIQMLLMRRICFIPYLFYG